jgi:restriction endonuclease Mrr
MYEIEQQIIAGNWHKVRRRPEIKKLARALKRWEAKQTIMTTTNN